jgi:serine/threonine-protein kinase
VIKTGSFVNNRYRVLNQIGSGGMSKVFLVEDINTGTKKALKESKIAKGELGNTHFQKMRHPGLIEIETVTKKGDRALVLMEYVEGESLQKVLIRNGAQPYRLLLDWMLQLCDILIYLHTRTPPIIYRDIKPSNIILQPKGMLKLIDFGAAREFRSGNHEDTVLLGTRGYAAPEQYGGCGQTDARTDIYGLGATMYHLSTGRDPAKPPYMDYPITYFASDIPQIFSDIIQKCTRFDPKKRYESSSELKSDLLYLRAKEAPQGGCIGSPLSRPFTCGFYAIETDITIVFTDKTL